MATGTIDNPVHDERIILMNARRLLPLYKKRRVSNWSLAMEIFGVGSTWARAICARVGADPDGTSIK
jgi:hypothetical protein